MCIVLLFRLPEPRETASSTMDLFCLMINCVFTDFVIWIFYCRLIIHVVLILKDFGIISIVKCMFNVYLPPSID